MADAKTIIKNWCAAAGMPEPSEGECHALEIALSQPFGSAGELPQVVLPPRPAPVYEAGDYPSKGEVSCDCYAGVDVLAYGRACAEAQRVADSAALAHQPSGQPRAVAYLDLGAGGYMDIDTELDDAELAQLPRGRHMLAIVGTYGIDGYQPSGWAQPITPADAVYGLMAWLSGRNEVVTLSARHGAAIAADLAKSFCEANGLQAFSADYPTNLKYPESSLTQPSGQAQQVAEDAARLDWLDAKSEPSKMGWRVAIAPSGSVYVGPVIQLGGKITSIREAIDAARKGEGGEK